MQWRWGTSALNRALQGLLFLSPMTVDVWSLMEVHELLSTHMCALKPWGKACRCCGKEKDELTVGTWDASQAFESFTPEQSLHGLIEAIKTFKQMYPNEKFITCTTGKAPLQA